MEERKLVDIEEVKDVLGDTINSEGDYHHALRLLNGLSSVTEQDIVKPILDKIKTEIEEERVHDDWDFGQEIYYNNAIDQALQIIDKYKVESEVKE